MSLKKAKKQASSSANLSDSREDVAELRQKLMSFGWIQCDNSNCLKWRKVRMEVAKKITEDMPWTCSENEDENFNSCSIPEEDTTLYDKLAKRVDLDIIKSKLRAGTLIWAKVSGYCRWPALITTDPLNGKHTDEDEFEALQYHVEFLGEKRSHCWIRTKFVEVFGPGNMEETQGKKCPESSSSVKKGGAKKKKRLTNVSKLKSKELYQRNRKLEIAIQEALQLLPLEMEERLRTCQYVSSDDVENVIPVKRKKTKKVKVSHHVTAQSVDLNPAMGGRKIRNTIGYPNRILGNRNTPSTRQHSGYLQPARMNENIGIPTKCLQFGENCKNVSCDISLTGKISKNLSLELKKANFLEFQSTLMSSISKEERFLRDVQMYKENEHAFEKDVTKFLLQNGLTLSDAPTWHNLQISIFALFLAVHGRHGYLKVCEFHQWPAVYTEVTHHHSKQGSGLAKRFYQRNLYSFELYIAGEDYTVAIRNQLQGHGKITFKKQQSVSETGDSGLGIEDFKAVFDEEDDFSCPDIARQLDELDEILKSLQHDEEREESYVPNLDGDFRLLYAKDFPELPLSQSANVVTGSGIGQPMEPEENAQVVPFLDFSTLTESSNNSVGNVPNSPHVVPDQVFHEMQALECDMDLLQDEIDLL